MWTFFPQISGLLKGQQSVLLILAALSPLIQSQAICLSIFILNINSRVPHFDQEVWLRFVDVSFSQKKTVGDESLFLWI